MADQVEDQVVDQEVDTDDQASVSVADFLETDDGASEVVDPQQPVCLLYTSPSPRDLSTSRMPSSA